MPDGFEFSQFTGRQFPATIQPSSGLEEKNIPSENWGWKVEMEKRLSIVIEVPPVP